MKVVINKCHGGFGLSHEAVLAYAKAKGIKLVWRDELGFRHYCTDLERVDETYFSERHDIPRDDPDLVAVVEKMGKKSFGGFAELGVIEIPDNISWEINEYDGFESVHESHRSWS